MTAKLQTDGRVSSGTLLEVTDLRTHFATPRGVVRAVDGVSFSLERGKALGIVGESGSGKTVSSLAIMDLLPSHARVTGSVRFEGQELVGLSDRELSRVRQNGIARDNEELELGVRCIAAGIYDDQRRLIAGLSISAPSDRLRDEWLEDLIATANNISAVLGYRVAESA